MDHEELTAEQIFFRYCWPIAERLLASDTITEECFRKLKFHRDNPHRQPDRGLLSECFPDDCRNIGKLGIERSSGLWDRELVLGYWHEYHGEFRVRTFVIVHHRFDGLIVLDEHAREAFLSNPYNLEIKEKDIVYGRSNTAIEKVICR